MCPNYDRIGGNDTGRMIDDLMISVIMDTMQSIVTRLDEYQTACYIGQSQGT